MSNNNYSPICMAEEYWANTHFSIARYYGRIKAFNHEYIIVNKEGKDIFKCSKEAGRKGRDKAIEPGEPCDLLRTDFVPHYKRLGRDKFLEILKENPGVKDSELKKILKSQKK